MATPPPPTVAPVLNFQQLSVVKNVTVYHTSNADPAALEVSINTKFDALISDGTVVHDIFEVKNYIDSSGVHHCWIYYFILYYNSSSAVQDTTQPGT